MMRYRRGGPGCNDASTISPVELAWGMTLGQTSLAPLPKRPDVTVRAAVEAQILEALLRPPCLVSFSGGRDSSAMLAIAVHVARREGLDLPIPATNRFAGAPATDEDDWQAYVLNHLGVSERLVLDFEDELGLIGPYATRFLQRHGARWPANTHMHAAIAEAARGGTVVTGFGGDELGRSSPRMFVGQLRANARVPTVRDLPMVALRLSPDVVRLAVFRRRTGADLKAMRWLTEGARREISGLAAWDEAREPSGWDDLLTHYFWPSRYLQLTLGSFRLLGSDYATTFCHPFVAGEVLGAYAAHGGPGGLGSRARILRQLVGDLLPDDILLRRSKASFTSAVWTSECIAFAQRWTGAGLRGDLVDADALRRDWLSPDGSARAMGLLQAAWMHEQDQLCA